MFEKKKIGHAELKRALRKDTMTNLTDNLKSWVCGTCGRALLSKAGYVKCTSRPRTEVYFYIRYG